MSTSPSRSDTFVCRTLEPASRNYTCSPRPVCWKWSNCKRAGRGSSHLAPCRVSSSPPLAAFPTSHILFCSSSVRDSARRPERKLSRS